MTSPPASPGPLRYILLGCGLALGVTVLGLGGCAGILYLVFKGTDGIAETGAAYVRNSPEVQKAAGAPLQVQRSWKGWKVNVHNDTGDAFMTYDVQGSEAKGSAEITLVKSGGSWSAVGGRFTGPGGTLLLGRLRRQE